MCDGVGMWESECKCDVSVASMAYIMTALLKCVSERVLFIDTHCVTSVKVCYWTVSQTPVFIVMGQFVKLS